MKISKLLKNDEIGLNAYILGSIFAFNYKKENDYISVFSSKNQKSTNHIIDINIFKDQIKRIEKYYDVKIMHKYSEISSNKYIKNKILKNQIGVFSIVKNDINKDLEYEIINKLNNKNNEIFAINFLRGVVDSRSSADTTTSYIAMDIKKKNILIFIHIILKTHDIVFGENNQQYNINPRFKQPSQKSRIKNPQFRFPYTVVFGKIGTFRIQFFQKLKKHKNNEFQRFKNMTKIPNNFKTLIKWNTSNIPYRPRNSINTKIIEGDKIYLDNYSKNKNEEEILYYKLKEKYKTSELNLTKRNTIQKLDLMKFLSKFNCKDFLEPNKKIDENKKGLPLLDIHHIIPYKYAFLFENKDIINNWKNLIPLRQDTHYFLHRGTLNLKKEKYLEKLFKYLKTFLIENKTIKKITFDSFKQMY